MNTATPVMIVAIYGDIFLEIVDGENVRHENNFHSREVEFPVRESVRSEAQENYVHNVIEVRWLSKVQLSKTMK